MESFDLIVVGTGAGTKLIQPVAKLGYKVCVIEKDALGGTCLNRGCIPSKMLLYPSEVLELTREVAPSLNLEFPERGKVHFQELIQRISETVDGDSNSIPPIYEKNPNITLIRGEAKFVSNYVLQVGERLVTSKRILLAIGCRPSLPELPGLLDTPFWTSREALRANKLPKSLLVIGGGYIGLELGFAFSAFGSKTTVITRRELLMSEDKEVRDEFRRVFSQNHSIIERAKLHSVQHNQEEFTLTISTPNGEQRLKAENLLVATGIQPNTDSIDIHKTDIQLNSEGYIQTGDDFQTNVPGIYAIGDVLGRYFFRHTANLEGEFLFESLYKLQQNRNFTHPPVPHAVFTHPQIASVGKTEEELIEEKVPYIKGVNPYSSSAMGMARQSQSGFVKVLVSPETKQILGAHIIGDEASNLLQMFVFAMTYNHPFTDLLQMIYIHPALPEVSRNALRKCKEAYDALQQT